MDFLVVCYVQLVRKIYGGIDAELARAAQFFMRQGMLMIL